MSKGQKLNAILFNKDVAAGEEKNCIESVACQPAMVKKKVKVAALKNKGRGRHSGESAR